MNKIFLFIHTVSIQYTTYRRPLGNEVHLNEAKLINVDNSNSVLMCNSFWLVMGNIKW